MNKGFIGLKSMLKRLLDEGKKLGKLSSDVSTSAVTEMLFAGMLGATVMYGADKSAVNLDRSIGSLIDYLELHSECSPRSQLAGAKCRSRASGMERSGNPAYLGFGECERIKKWTEFLTVARSTDERQNIPCKKLDGA